MVLWVLRSRKIGRVHNEARSSEWRREGNEKQLESDSCMSTVGWIKLEAQLPFLLVGAGGLFIKRDESA